MENADPKTLIKGISETQLAELSAKTGAIAEYNALLAASRKAFRTNPNWINPISKPESLKAISEMAGGAKGYMHALTKIFKEDSATSDGHISAAELANSTLSSREFISAVSILGEKSEKYTELLARSVQPRQQSLLYGDISRYIASVDSKTAVSYLELISVRWPRKEAFSKELLEYLSVQGGRAQEFLEYLRDYSLDAKYVLPVIVQLWKDHRKEMTEKADGAIDIFSLVNNLQVSLYDSHEEFGKIVKSLTKEEIRRLAQSTIEITYSHNRYSYALKYIKRLDEGLGFSVRERVNALSALSTFSLIAKEMESNRSKSMEEELRSVVIKNERTFNRNLNLIDPSSMYCYLRSDHPDLHDYLVRHLHTPSSNAASSIDEWGVLVMVNMYRRLREAYPISSSLKTGAASKEKHQIATIRNVDYREKYEQAFTNELFRSVERALTEARSLEARKKYEEFLSCIDLKKIFFSGFKKSADQYQVSEQVENLIQAYFGLDRHKPVLRKFLRKYLDEGSAQAGIMIRSNPANTRVMKKMAERGTNLPQIYSLSADYLLGSKGLSTRLQGLISEAYAEILGLLPSLGANLLNLRREMGYLEGCTMVEKSLSNLTEPNQLLAKEKIKVRINDLRSMHSQMEALKSKTKVHFYVSSDYLEALQLGVGFGSCLDIMTGYRRHAALSRAFDANNFTLFARKGSGLGQIISRVSVIETNKGMLLNSKFYENTPLDLYANGTGWIDFLSKFASSSNRELIIPFELVEENPAAQSALKLIGAELIEREMNAESELGMAGTDTYSDLDSLKSGGKTRFSLGPHYLLQARTNVVVKSDLSQLSRGEEFIALA